MIFEFWAFVKPNLIETKYERNWKFEFWDEWYDHLPCLFSIHFWNVYIIYVQVSDCEIIYIHILKILSQFKYELDIA